MWNIEKIVSKGDYNYAIVRKHPNATKNNYVLHHRIVIENHLGRILNTNEVVHHKNGNKKDNRLDNLELMAIDEHARHHAFQRGKKMVLLKCPSCQNEFVREYGQTHFVKRNRATFCSRSCNGLFSRNKQLYGETIQMQEAISGNVLQVYLDNSEQTD